MHCVGIVPRLCCPAYVVIGVSVSVLEECEEIKPRGYSAYVFQVLSLAWETGWYSKA
jgi:hypothetical protein